jgi:hypothetical protein
LLQIQKRWPHLMWQRSSNVEFNHMPTVTPSSLATTATFLMKNCNRHCCWQQAVHHICYSLHVLHVQECWPHPTWQRSSNVEFDRMPTVTPSSLATTATCFPKFCNRHLCWQQAGRHI